jgi:hypothetical protein
MKTVPAYPILAKSRTLTLNAIVKAVLSNDDPQLITESVR